MNVLYYSNYCDHCKNLLVKLSKSHIKKDIYFICVDKRKVHNGTTYIVLEDGKEITLPNIITSVPSIILFSRGNMLLKGNDILKYINQQMEAIEQIKEPDAFSMNFSSFTSDSYSYLDTDPEEMNAQGNGGTRQMHNYVSFDYNDQISTPPDNYVPDKIGSDNTMERIMKQREEEVPRQIQRIS